MKAQAFPLSRPLKQMVLMVADAILVAIALWVSCLLADPGFYVGQLENFFIYLGLISLSSVLIFYYQGIYRTVLLYMGMQSMLIILKAISLTTLILAVVMYFDDSAAMTAPVIPIFWMVSLLLIGGKRILIKP